MKLTALHRHQKYVVRPIPGKDSFTYAELFFKSLNKFKKLKQNFLIFYFMQRCKLNLVPLIELPLFELKDNKYPTKSSENDSLTN